MDMQGEFQSQSEFDINEVLHIASAIADREIIEAKRNNDIIRQVSPGTLPDEELTPELVKKIALLKVAKNIQRIENPDTVYSFLEEAKESFNDMSIAISEQSEHDGMPVAPDQVRETLESFMVSTTEAIGITDEKTAAHFKKFFLSAKAVAARYDVSVADVYTSEDLYAEASHETYSIEEYTENYITVIKGFNEQVMTSIMMNIVHTLIPKDELDELDHEELAGLMLDMQMDPTIQYQITNAVKTMADVTIASVKYNLKRFYSDQEVNSLSDETKKILRLTTPPRVIEIGGVALTGLDDDMIAMLTRRDQFTTDYCASKGWDRDDVTLEQIIEIRNQDGWLNP